MENVVGLDFEALGARRTQVRDGFFDPIISHNFRDVVLG
jgi:hypothetical protein